MLSQHCSPAYSVRVILVEVAGHCMAEVRVHIVLYVFQDVCCRGCLGLFIIALFSVGAAANITLLVLL